MTGDTRHGCVLAINDIGILIEGRSGAGKTSLMFGLVERFRRAGIDTEIVCDDYCTISQCEQGLMASAPDPIAGKAELRGYGIVSVAHRSNAKLGLIVSLVPDEDVERMPEPQTATILNVTLPLIHVPERHEEAAVRIITARLGDFSDGRLPFPLP